MSSSYLAWLVLPALLVCSASSARVNQKEGLDTGTSGRLSNEEEDGRSDWSRLPCRSDTGDAWVTVRLLAKKVPKAKQTMCPGQCQGQCSLWDWYNMPAPLEPNASSCCCKSYACPADALSSVEHAVGWSTGLDHILGSSSAKKHFGIACCRPNNNTESTACDSWRYSKTARKEFCATPPGGDNMTFWSIFGSQCVERPFRPPTKIFRSMKEWDGRVVYKKRTRTRDGVCDKEYRLLCLGRVVDPVTGDVEDEGYVAMNTSASCTGGATASGLGVRYFGGYSNWWKSTKKVCTEQKNLWEKRSVIAVNPDAPMDSDSEYWLNNNGMCLEARPVDPEGGLPLVDITDAILTSLSQSILRKIFLSSSVPACLCCSQPMSFYTRVTLGVKAWLKNKCKLAYAMGKRQMDEDTESNVRTPEEAASQAVAGVAGGAAYAHARKVAGLILPFIGGSLFDWGSKWTCQAVCNQRQAPVFDRYEVGMVHYIPGEAAKSWLIPV